MPHEPTQFAQDVTGDLPSLLTAFTNSLPLTATQKKLLEDVKSRLGDTPFNETDIEALIRAGYLDPDAIAAMIKGGNLTAYQNANLVKVMNAQTKEKQLDMVALISKGIEVDTVIQLVNNKADLKDIAKNAQILLDGGVKLELINIWLKNKTNLNDAVAIHKQGVDLNQLGTSSQVGDFSNTEGASVNEILSRIPKNAKIEHWTPVPGHSQQGMKFVWQDAAGNKWHVRMHDPDPGAGPGSNSASGWTLRVQRGDDFMDKGGKFHKVGILKPTFKDGKPNPRFNPGAANDTHIPIQNP